MLNEDLGRPLRVSPCELEDCEATECADCRTGIDPENHPVLWWGPAGWSVCWDCAAEYSPILASEPFLLGRDEFGLYPVTEEDLWLVEVHGVVRYAEIIRERVEQSAEVCDGCGARTGRFEMCREDCPVMLAEEAKFAEETGNCDCCENLWKNRDLRIGWDVEGGPGFQACPDCVERIDREYPGETIWGGED